MGRGKRALKNFQPKTKKATDESYRIQNLSMQQKGLKNGLNKLT